MKSLKDSQNLPEDNKQLVLDQKISLKYEENSLEDKKAKAH